MQAISRNSLPQPLSNLRVNKAALSGSSIEKPLEGQTAVRFQGVPSSKSQTIRFGGFGEGFLKALKGFGLGSLGLASGVLLWPLSIAAGLLGIIFHPLLPISLLLGLAPFGLAIWGGVSGAKSK